MTPTQGVPHLRVPATHNLASVTDSEEVEPPSAASPFTGFGELLDHFAPILIFSTENENDAHYHLYLIK